MKRVCNIYLYKELIIIVKIDYLDFILVALRSFGFKDEDLFVEYEDLEDDEDE